MENINSGQYLEESDLIQKACEEFSKLSDEQKKIFMEKMINEIVANSDFKRKTEKLWVKDTGDKIEILGFKK